MKKVMVFGTFDILHQGHLSFFNQAKKLGDHLIVVVARDKYVKEAKGVEAINNEELRIKNVKKSNIPDKVIHGSKTHNFYRTIRKYQPAIIALGYDQKPTLLSLKRDLKRNRILNIKLFRLLPFKPHIFKSKFLVK